MTKEMLNLTGQEWSKLKIRKLEELKLQVMAQNPMIMGLPVEPKPTDPAFVAQIQSGKVDPRLGVSPNDPIWGKQGEWVMYENPMKTQGTSRTDIFGWEVKGEPPVVGMMTFYVGVGSGLQSNEVIAKLLEEHKTNYITHKVIKRLEDQGVLCVFIPIPGHDHSQEYVKF